MNPPSDFFPLMETISGPLKKRRKAARRGTEKKLNWNSHQACERKSIKLEMKIVVMQAVGLPKIRKKTESLCADYNPFRSCGLMPIVDCATSTAWNEALVRQLFSFPTQPIATIKRKRQIVSKALRAMAKFKVKQIQPKNDFFCSRNLFCKRSTSSRRLGVSGKWDFVGCRVRGTRRVSRRTPIVMNYSCVTA